MTRSVLFPLVLLLLSLISPFVHPTPPAPPSEQEPDRPGLYYRPVSPVTPLPVTPPVVVPRPLPRPWPVDEYQHPGRWMSVALDVLVDGQPILPVAHAGRMYLPVPRLGAEYTLRVRNQGPRRIAAVLSVDGLSVLTGGPASERDPGYVVDPRSEVLIAGWRRDRMTVAAFTFQPHQESHAVRTGHPENVGVIGLVAFEEKAIGPPLWMESPGRSLDGRRAVPAEVGGTGTGAGRDVPSVITPIAFVRSANRRSVTLYYDTADNLRRAGVPVAPYWPQPFPRDW